MREGMRSMLQNNRKFSYIDVQTLSWRDAIPSFFANLG